MSRRVQGIPRRLVRNPSHLEGAGVGASSSRQTWGRIAAIAALMERREAFVTVRSERRCARGLPIDRRQAVKAASQFMALPTAGLPRALVLQVLFPQVCGHAFKPMIEGPLEVAQSAFKALGIAVRWPAAVIHERHRIDAPVPVLGVRDVVVRSAIEPTSTPSNAIRQDGGSPFSFRQVSFTRTSPSLGTHMVPGGFQ
jgi:hypothetical protein